MCDCFHLAFPNWHATSSGTGGGRRLRGPEHGVEDDSICDEPPRFIEGERPRPQGSSPVEEYPETEKYTDSEKEGEGEHDPHHKSGSKRRRGKKSGFGSMFEKRSTPKMSKLKEVHSPESEVIVKTAKEGCAEGLVYGGGGEEGIFIKEVVPESPASKNLQLKEGDQLLSATVYFDNISYEDAIQILEHAQAYKVKLCLKRKPEITDTEAVIEPEAIPEEELYSPQMREQGKTKRHGDARISWPKFPSFSKRRKSRFTRSHSSSEADEQRKLELSPTTSDTESPIKSQDALKGKKKHKIKLPVLTKRGRISSSEDQDTEAPITGPISGLESPSAEPHEIYVTEELKEVQAADIRLEQNNLNVTEPPTVQHKVELITIDSTLKTEELTMALAGQESPSDGRKKKKKERSELKMRIMGKDKAHKQDAKVKSSPKRLQTLGASIEKTDPPETEKSAESVTELQVGQITLDTNTQVINSESSKVTSAETGPAQREIILPMVKLDICDVESPHKSKVKTKKQTDFKQKTDTKSSPTFKLPKIGFTDITTEETEQKMDVNIEECKSKIKHLATEGTEVIDDPYDRLSKVSISKTQLPKREDIEIPGMEDVSMRTKTQGIKEPKAAFAGHFEEIQAETLHLSIDVDSVKEAVSKLPGFKLPKVDMSGVPIPEEITVIDANAQRISVKTPTKVIDTKTKHGIQCDISDSPEISMTSVKLPKIKAVDLSSQELVRETKIDVGREDIVIPGKESIDKVTILQAQGPDGGIQSTYGSTAMPSPKESDKKSRKATITTPSFGITKPDIRFPDVGVTLDDKKPENGSSVLKLEAPIEIHSTDGSSAKTDTKITVNLYATDHATTREVKDIEIREQGGRFKLPKVGLSVPKVKGPEIDLHLGKNETKAEAPEIDVDLGKVEVSIPDTKLKVEKPELEMKPLHTDAEIDGRGGKFKMPKFGVSLRKVKAPEIDLGLSKKDMDDTPRKIKVEVKLPDVEIKEPSAKVEVKAPETAVHPQKSEGSALKFKMPTFKRSKSGAVSVEVPDMYKEIKIDGADVKEESTVDVATPDIDTDGPSLDVTVTGTEGEGKGGKFKMPKFGMSLPKVKAPEIDSSTSKKKVDVTLPQAKFEAQLPGVPDMDISLGKVDGSIPEEKLGVEKPELDIKTLQTEVEIDGKGGKFKMPKFGMSLPKVKGPEIDLTFSKKDGAVELPETEAQVQLPDIELKEPSGKVEIKAPEIEADFEGSPSKFKMPTFKLPKFGANVSVEAPVVDKDIKISEAKLKTPKKGAAVDITAPCIDIEGPSVDMETTGAELQGKGSKFKMPKLGVSLPKVKGPEIDLSSSKKDVDVKLPQAEAEVQLPAIGLKEPYAKVEIKAPEFEADVEGSASKFKMPSFKLPKFGAATANVRIEAPAVDKDTKISEAKLKTPKKGAAVDITAPGIDIEGPSVDMETTGAGLQGKGSKFKMPKLGVSLPKVKGPEIDLSLSKKDVDVKLPQAEAEVQLPNVELKEPLAKVDIEVPEIEADVEGSPSKFKMPTFKLPKFGAATPNVSIEVPDVDEDIKISGAELKTPKGAAVDIMAPGIDVEGPSVDMKTTGAELQGKGSKFKMPKLGVSLPKVKGPEIDLSLSKKDVDVTLPQAEAEVQLPAVELKEPSAKVDITGLKIEADVEGSPSKFKMPSFKLPTFGAATQHVSIEVPDVEKDIKISEAELKTPKGVAVDITAPGIDVEGPSVDMKTTGAELQGKRGKFKMPKLGVSLPKVKGPEIDLSLSKKYVDVTLPQAEAEVKIPDVKHKEPGMKVEVKAPEIAVHQKDVEGSPSKFKMPTFKLPKFGVSTPHVTVDIPEMDKHVKLDETDMKTLEGELAVDVSGPSLDIEGPSIDVKTTGKELEGKGSKFKMPSLSFSMPKVKGPKIDLSLPKKDVDVTLSEPEVEVKLLDAPDIDVSLGKVNVSVPEANLEVNKPELDFKTQQAEVEIDGQGGKFKMPKFGMSLPKVKGPEIDLSLSKKDIDASLPKAKAEVKLPDVEIKEPAAKVDIKAPAKDVEGSPSKFKMPTFKLPKFGLSTPNVTVEVPEMDKQMEIGEGQLKTPKEGVAIDITAPGIQIEDPLVDVKTTGAELQGKGSKFKMPKLGVSLPKVKGPEIDLSVSKKDVDVKLPEGKAEVKLPDVDLKEPSAEVDIKAPEIKVATKDVEGSPSKFKMPSFKLPKFGVSASSVTAAVPETDKHITTDGAELKTAEIEPVADIPAASMEIEGPSIDVKTTRRDPEGKGSKFKMPSLSFSMPKVKGPKIDLSLQKKDVDVALPETKAEVKLPEAPGIDVSLGKVDVSIPEAKLEVNKPEVDTKPLQTEAELDAQGGKFKMPKFGISLPKVQGPEVDLSSSKTDVEVKLPEVKAEVQLQDLEIKEPSAEVHIKAAEIDVQTHKSEGSTYKFKMPTFKLPKFGTDTPNVTVEVPDMDKDMTIDGAELKIPTEGATVDMATPKIEVEGPLLDMTMTGIEVDGKGGKFKLPKFGVSLPKVQGPEINISSSKKDIDVTLPDAKAEINLPEAPEIDVSLRIAHVSIPEAKLEVKKPEVDIKPLHTEAELDGEGGTFKMPKFGMSLPKVKGPEIDLSLSKKHADMKLPEAKAEFKVPDVELKEPSAKTEIEAPEIETNLHSMEGSSMTFKMPTFRLPKFGADTHVNVEAPALDECVTIDGAELTVPKEEATADIAASSTDIDVPSLNVTMTGTVGDRKGDRFKLPKFGVSQPKVRPEFDLSLSKKDIDVTVPEAKAEINLPEAPDIDVSLGEDVSIPEAKLEVNKPEVDTKPLQIEAELDGQGGKFKMPKFGMSLPKVKGPEIDFSVQEDMDVTVADIKAEVQLPEIEVKEPSDVELKKPRFTLPRFSFSKQSVQGPEVDVSLPNVNVSVPEGSVEVKEAEVDIKAPESEVEIDGQGSKFKMPKFGITMPKVKGHDIDVSASKKDIDVTLPEAKAEIKLPNVELKEPSAKVEIKAPEIEAQITNVEASPSKFKMPSFKMPKFGAATPKVSVEVPDTDKDIKVDGAELKIPQDGTLSLDIEGPSVDVKTAKVKVEGEESKFEMPNLGLTTPQVKGPEIDSSLSRKDIDLKVTDIKAEVKLPDVEIKQLLGTISVPEAITEGDAKLKKTSWAMPKFSFSRTSVKAPDADIKLDAPGVDVTLPEAKTEVHLPGVDIKESSGDISMEGSPAMDLDAKFKRPKFSLTRFTFSKKEVEAGVSLPEVDVSLPEGKVEVKQPEVKLDTELREPEVDVKSLESGLEIDGQGSKFKLPKFGIAQPKGSEFNLSKKNVDVTLPEAKAEVELPDVEVTETLVKAEIKAPEIEVQVKPVEGSPSRFKMPTFKLPKFGAGTPTVSVEVPDKDIKVDVAELKIPKKEVTVDVSAPSIDTEGSSLDVKARGGEIEGTGTPTVEVEAKLKKTSWTLPKFSFSKSSVTETEPPNVEVEVQQPEVQIKGPELEAEEDGQGSKFKLPTFGISRVKGPEVELQSSQKNADVTLPGVKAEVQLPEAPVTEVKVKDVGGSPLKFKMPTLKMPRFGGATQDVTVEVPEADKDSDGVKLKTSVEGAAPSIDIEGPSIDVKSAGDESDEKGIQFKMPSFGISMQKVKGPDIDSSPKKGVDVTIPEAKAEVKPPDVEVKGTSATISVDVPDAPTIEIEDKLKKSSWTLPKFSFSKTSVKAPDGEVSLEPPRVEDTLPEAKAKVDLPNVEVKEPSASISMQEPPPVDADAKPKKSKFSLFSFSRSSAKEPEVNLPAVDISLPEGTVEVKHPDVEIKSPENLLKKDVDVTISETKAEIKLPDIESISVPGAPSTEVDDRSKKSRFSLFSFSRSVKEPEADISLPKVDETLPEGKVEVKPPAAQTEAPTSEIQLKEPAGSPSKFKMPTLSLPTFGAASSNFTGDVPEVDKGRHINGSELSIPKEGVTSAETDVSKDSETSKIETDIVGHGSPSKFKLPLFKMPKLNFSKSKPEDEHLHVETESKHDDHDVEMEVKPQGVGKSPLTLTLGEVLKTLDVEFDVPKRPEVGQNRETMKDVHGTDEVSTQSNADTQPVQKEDGKLTNDQQDQIKSPERTGWFRFPRFGLSSPSEPAKTPEKEEQQGEKSPVGDTVDEDVSTTCSVRSSDAFADISSAMTSENVGLSLSSPTKVTVKYSDPNAAVGLAETHGNIITSTTRTEMISAELNLPEKITIPSSGVSSSSEDTLKLESGKIHVITSNIQATPEAQHAKLLTAVHVQSATGLPLKSESYEAASWTIEESQSSGEMVFQRQLIRETSSENRETIVITKKITHVYGVDSSEPISDETATSIQRLRDSVHTEKMKFFDGAEK